MVLFVDGKNLRHHGHHQKLSVEPDICVRTRLPFSERVNPYVAPRHVIARYCAITLHLAVIQMHRGPIGEAPEGQKSSTFLPDLHLSSQSRSKARTPRVPRIPNSRPSKSATRSSFPRLSAHFVATSKLFQRNSFSFRSLTYHGRLICHRWKSQLCRRNYLCAKPEEIRADLFHRSCAARVYNCRPPR